MAQALKDLNESLIEPAFDRRKAKRLFLSFPIELSGVDGAGQPFAERTKTEDVSDKGCRLVTTIPVKRGDIVNIRLANPPGTRFPEKCPQQFEVMWVQQTKTGWAVGARKILDGKMWEVSFPPPKSVT